MARQWLATFPVEVHCQCNGCAGMHANASNSCNVGIRGRVLSIVSYTNTHAHTYTLVDTCISLRCVYRNVCCTMMRICTCVCVRSACACVQYMYACERTGKWGVRLCVELSCELMRVNLRCVERMLAVHGHAYVSMFVPVLRPL